MYIELGFTSSLMATMYLVHKKADKASTRVGRLGYSSVIESEYFALIAATAEALNTNLLVTIFSFTIPVLLLNPAMLFGGKRAAEPNRGPTMDPSRLRAGGGGPTVEEVDVGQGVCNLVGDQHTDTHSSTVKSLTSSS